MSTAPAQRLQGIAASPGIAIGKAYIHRAEAPAAPRRRVSQVRTGEEVERFLTALRQVGDEMRRTRRLVEMEHGADLAQIFDAQLAMLDDTEVKDATVARIKAESETAEAAFEATLATLKAAFERIDNEYLRARVGDVRDIEHQVLARLAGGELQGLQSLRSNTVVVARDLLPSEAAHLGRRLVKGMVTDAGGATSHASIIARSLGLPAVVGAERASRCIESGDIVVVDGDEGVVHVRPSRDTLRYYSNELRRQLRRQRELSERTELPAVTLDGTQIALLANLDLPQETQVAIDNGARGVGMFRTEFLYMGYDLPSEEQQLAAYTRIVEAFAPRPVVIRTIDLGGDKLAHAVETSSEANPFLGWRGIRICLDMPELFRTQLRAILRAGARGEVQILLPMISTLSEVRRAREMIRETAVELRAEGRPFQQDCKVGIMVEVPSAAITSDQFAREVDFFSLGTNDLTQYTLAVDRGQPKVASLFDSLHPAVLTLIKSVADSARRQGIPASVCGEMAGDPVAAFVLLGLGLRALSVSPGLIPEVKEIVRGTRLAEAERVAAQCLQLDSGAAARQLIEAALEASGSWRGVRRGG
ncbi:MAG: phosphoenolpyruvate--protein phosphotransferase [Gemmatimonadota bacterium]